jgi:hypothetical protein
LEQIWPKLNIDEKNREKNPGDCLPKAVPMVILINNENKLTFDIIKREFILETDQYSRIDPKSVSYVSKVDNYNHIYSYKKELDLLLNISFKVYQDKILVVFDNSLNKVEVELDQKTQLEMFKELINIAREVNKSFLELKKIKVYCVLVLTWTMEL